MQTPLSDFGNYLTQLRRLAGFQTLEQAIEFAKQELEEHPGFIARSTLNLYELGKIANVKPIVLRFLSELYSVDYSELATKWFQSYFGVEAKLSVKDEGFVINSSKSLCSLLGPTSDPRDNIEIISLPTLEATQRNLPAKAQVGVVATDFLDDHVFFDMVSNNIRRGVRYHYLLPETERVAYETLLVRIGNKYSDLRGKLDGKLTHFHPRPNLDFPVNYVLYLYPSGKVEGYVGILHGTDVQYHQRADVKLALRLYDAFRWSVSVSSDQKVRTHLDQLDLVVRGKIQGANRKHQLSPILLK